MKNIKIKSLNKIPNLVSQNNVRKILESIAQKDPKISTVIENIHWNIYQNEEELDDILNDSSEKKDYEKIFTKLTGKNTTEHIGWYVAPNTIYLNQQNDELNEITLKYPAETVLFQCIQEFIKSELL